MMQKEYKNRHQNQRLNMGATMFEVQTFQDGKEDLLAFNVSLC